MSGLDWVLIPIIGMVLFATVMGIIVIRQDRREKHRPATPPK